MSTFFTNKTIVITGASQGLGKRLAENLAKYQAKLVLFARNEEKLTEVVKKCREKSPNTHYVCGDVGKKKDCQHLAEKTKQLLGEADILINNAGVSMWSSFSENKTELVQKILEINFLGAVNCTHYFLPQLRKKKGSIVNISSLQALIGVPFHSGYSASKHALEGFFQSLALEETLLHILNVYPYWIKGTSINQNRIDRQMPKKREAKGIDAQKCTEKILQALAKKQNQLFLPKYLQFLPLLKMIFPNLLAFIIKKKTKDIQNSSS